MYTYQYLAGEGNSNYLASGEGEGSVYKVGVWGKERVGSLSIPLYSIVRWGRLVVLWPFCGLSSRKAGLIGPSLHF